MARPSPKRKAPSRAVAAKLYERLVQAMPDPRIELAHEGPWQLLVATILSAQSTDKMVNRITPALFARFPTPAALGAASQEEVEALVKSSGFFRNKAKAIRAASALIAERFGGRVPLSMEELTSLPGVARKTANVVLSDSGVAAGVVVDTHAGRVSRRLGLTREEDPQKVEAALCALFPQEQWIGLGLRLVLHGRYVCLARRPACALCPLNELCPSREAPPEGTAAQRAEGERALVAGGVAA